MEWPAYSPDLNPIEHAWDMSGRVIAKVDPQPLTRELLTELQIQWAQISQQAIKNYSDR